MKRKIEVGQVRYCSNSDSYYVVMKVVYDSIEVKWLDNGWHTEYEKKDIIGDDVI